MEVLAYSGALLIGILLGMTGGGGSILTLPVLVYLLGINPILATAYSLFVVGITSLAGAIIKFRESLVDLKIAIVFAIPSCIAVYFTRLYLFPAIPEILFETSWVTVKKEATIMVFFSTLMLMTAVSMIKSRKNIEHVDRKKKTSYLKIVIDGLVVGILTGIVGAGGGFLIIPALVLLAKLPMKLAVGTSLTIIAVKSLIGFLGDVQSGQNIDWSLLFIFSNLAVAGVFAGNLISRLITEEKLKKIFGWFVLTMSLAILFKELITG